MDKCKRIDKRANTIKVYEVCYKNYLAKAFNKMLIDDITETDIQNLINESIEKKKTPTTIKTIKLVMQPILEINDVMLNWKKLFFINIQAIENSKELIKMQLQLQKFYYI